MGNYGFKSSNDVKLDTFGWPLGKYTVHAVGQGDTATGIMVDYTILTGEHANKSFGIYYNTTSDNEITAKIAQQDIKRIADATGKPVDDANPISGRTFTVEVEPNKKNPLYTNVKFYLPADGVSTAAKAAAATVAEDKIPF
jgi:hypothetical protein